jgi:hypothetical protein
MDDKTRALADLRTVYNQWKELTTRLREPELVAPVAGDLSVKDMVAHLRGWQMVSIARLEAAQTGREPVLPGWLAGGDPDTESDAETDAHNERIFEMHRAQSWAEVNRAWRDGFLRLLALAEAIPAADLADRAKYPWLNGHALIDVLHGTWDHHREHLEELV